MQTLPVAGEDQRARVAALPEHGVHRGYLQRPASDKGGACDDVM